VPICPVFIGEVMVSLRSDVFISLTEFLNFSSLQTLVQFKLLQFEGEP